MVPVITVHGGLAPLECMSLLDTPATIGCPIYVAGVSEKMKIAIAQSLENTGRNAGATGTERGVSNRGQQYHGFKLSILVMLLKTNVDGLFLGLQALPDGMGK